MSRILMISISEYKNDPRVRREAEYLVSLEHSVYVISLAKNTDDNNYELNGVFIYPILQKFCKKFNRERLFLKFILLYLLFGIIMFIKTLKLFLKNRFKIIHFHNPPDFMVFFLLPFRIFFGSKLVLDRHEYTYLALTEIFNNRLKFFQSLIYAIEGISINMFDFIIVISKWDKRYVCKRGFSSGSVTIIPNTVDEAIYFSNLRKKNKSKIKNLDTQKDNLIKIIYQGSIFEERDLKTLVEAVSILSSYNDISPFKIFILGDGPYLKILKQLVHAKNLGNKFSFLGRVPFSEVAIYTEQCDIGFISAINTKFWEFSSPNKILEYLALDKLVIASDFLSWKEIGEQAILYFKRGDPFSLSLILHKVLKEPIIIKQKIPQIKRVYKKWRWEVIQKQLKKCYEKLLSK